MLPEARLNERNHVPGVNGVVKVVTPEALDAKLLAEGARADQAVRYEQGLLFNPWVSGGGGETAERKLGRVHLVGSACKTDYKPGSSHESKQGCGAMR